MVNRSIGLNKTKVLGWVGSGRDIDTFIVCSPAGREGPAGSDVTACRAATMRSGSPPSVAALAGIHCTVRCSRFGSSPCRTGFDRNPATVIGQSEHGAVIASVQGIPIRRFVRATE